MRKIRAVLKTIVFHPDPIARLKITLAYCGIGVYTNFFILQVFCMPVLYAAVMCVIFFFAILVFPFVKVNWVKNGLYFLLGTGVPICVYCIMFLGDPHKRMANYIGFILEILLLGAGLLAFIPFYLLFHILKYYKEADRSGKMLLLLGISLPMIALGVYLFNLGAYFKLQDNIAKHSVNVDDYISRLPNNYFTERELGLCWKYHTNLEYINDGWRPPLHDPFVVIGIWLMPLIAPRGIPVFTISSDKESIKFYHRKFPERPLKECCPCSYSHDGKRYLSDPFDSIPGKGR